MTELSIDPELVVWSAEPETRHRQHVRAATLPVAALKNIASAYNGLLAASTERDTASFISANSSAWATMY